MKKIYFLLLLLCGFVNAQIVTIPDNNFRAKLIALGVDTNADGNIQQSEALARTTLDVYTSNISDLTGIESFTNLTELNCYGNHISTLNLTALISLTSLYCYNNNSLTSLNVSGLTLLNTLDCRSNLLTTLNLAGLTSLNYFDCAANLLTSLNVSGLTSLIYLNCSSNHLTTLNVSGLPALSYFMCGANQLTSLNFTNCAALADIGCGFNQLTSLDLTGLGNLNSFTCYNNLISNFVIPNNIAIINFDCSSNQLVNLDLSKLTLNSFNIYGNPLETVDFKNGHVDNIGDYPFYASLQFMCADDNEVTAMNNFLVSEGVLNVVANPYCSFVPGGNYNTITGTVTFDINNNGCDANDAFQPNIRVNINNGTTSGAGFTNTTGNYTLFTQTGSFPITPNATENPTWFTFSPPNATIPFANNSNNTVTQNFCVTANGIHADVEVVIMPITPARPGFDAVYRLVFRNKGNQTLSGNVSFNYNDAVLDFVSSTVVPNSQSTGLLTFNYTNLMPFENRSFSITLNVNGPTETPAINIGDQLDFTAIINPIAGDENSFDNTFPFKQIVVGSFDPNDIICLEGNVVAPTEIGKYLHYVINFENTGTAAAENIVVKDVIDTTKYDISTLQVINSSAPVSTKITANVAEFILQNINLGANQHGNVVFKIKTKNTLVEGNSVSNRADIFFDYNFPIDTGYITTTFQALSNPNFDLDNSISVYPNPTSNVITIKANETLKAVQLFDVQGRVLVTKIEEKNQINFDVSHFSNGVYFLKVTTEKGSKTERIVKE